MEDASLILEKLLQEVDAGARIVLTRADAPDILLVSRGQFEALSKGQTNRDATGPTLTGQTNRG